MAKAQKCTVICNTKNGYCISPKECNSIREAVRYAKELDLAYRILVDGKLVKYGW